MARFPGTASRTNGDARDRPGRHVPPARPRPVRELRSRSLVHQRRFAPGYLRIQWSGPTTWQPPHRERHVRLLRRAFRDEWPPERGRLRPTRGRPELGAADCQDASAVEELYFGIDGPWAPFQPIVRSVAANEPLDYELAPGVAPVGGPAIAEWAAPSVDIVVRGEDGKIYETWNDHLGTAFLDWADWTVVADHVDADPGLVFAGPSTLHLVVRSAVDGSIRLRTRTAGVWGRWGSLGAPSVGAASAPAIAAQDEQSLTVFVRGGDNLIYQLECTDPVTMCAASAAAVDAWTALPASDVGGFLGRPSAAWMADGSGLLMVTAIGVDHAAWIIGPAPNNWGGWLPLHISVSPEDLDPGVALASNTGLGQLNYFTRDENGLLQQKIDSGAMFELGGMPISTPGAVGTARGDLRVDVVALIDDHGHPGVWWKFLSTQNTPL